MSTKMLMVLLLLIAIWNTWSANAVAVPTGPLRSYITGGFRGVQSRNLRSSLDCTQYANDLEVLYYLPFLVMINPMNHQWEKSNVQMDPSDTFVTQLYIRDHDSIIPESIFCLKRLIHLEIENMKFINDVVPDSLGNLKKLSGLHIRNTRINNMTLKLTTLSSLHTLSLYHCSLTQLPNLNELDNLQYVAIQYNFLSQLVGLNGPNTVQLEYNNFTDLPVFASPNTVQHLYMTGNPLKHIMPIGSFVNLHTLASSYTSITFIPPNIDRLNNLNYLDISFSKLTYLPKNILKLNKLRYVYVQGNHMDTTELSNIRREFNQTLPDCNLYS